MGPNHGGKPLAWQVPSPLTPVPGSNTVGASALGQHLPAQSNPPARKSSRPPPKTNHPPKKSRQPPMESGDHARKSFQPAQKSWQPATRSRHCRRVTNHKTPRTWMRTAASYLTLAIQASGMHHAWQGTNRQKLRLLIWLVAGVIIIGTAVALWRLRERDPRRVTFRRRSGVPANNFWVWRL